MERKFPGYTPGYNGDLSLDRVNTVKKFMLDQTIGTIVNTVLFIAGIGALKGKDRHAIFKDVDRVRLRCLLSGDTGLTPQAGFLAPYSLGLEALAHGLPRQFCSRTCRPKDTCWKHRRAFLGHLP